MKYFTNCTTLEELKKEYRRFAMKNHPDHGGDTKTMQDINNEYEAAFKILKNKHNAAADENHQSTEAPEEFISIINALLNIPGIIVELCGEWLWITGETYSSKDKLKAAGCRWSSSKKQWYWHPPYSTSHRSNGKATMDEIRSKYGSQTFKNGQEQHRIAAAV